MKDARIFFKFAGAPSKNRNNIGILYFGRKAVYNFRQSAKLTVWRLINGCTVSLLIPFALNNRPLKNSNLCG